MSEPIHHDVVVIGGGNGGVSAAALLRRRGCADVALVEPSAKHVYKPLQNYIGTGLAHPRELQRPQAALIPRGVRWYETVAVRVDAEARIVACADGSLLHYGDLLLAPGAMQDWDATPGSRDALAEGVACTTFLDSELDGTRQQLAGLTHGTALFVLPAQPVSGRETALKPLFIACDTWRRRGVLGDIDVLLAVEDDRLHPVSAIESELQRHISEYGIRVVRGARVDRIEGSTVVLRTASGEERQTVDLVHLVPRYVAPTFVQASGLDGGNTGGFLAVDAETLQHPRHPRIWCVGDAADLGDARTGGALRHQVRVAVDNIRRRRAGEPLERYDGYTVAPVATSRNRLSFGEYDRSFAARRSLPVPDQVTARAAWFLLDRYILPQLYWHAIIRGRI